MCVRVVCGTSTELQHSASMTSWWSAGLGQPSLHLSSSPSNRLYMLHIFSRGHSVPAGAGWLLQALWFHRVNTAADRRLHSIPQFSSCVETVPSTFPKICCCSLSITNTDTSFSLPLEGFAASVTAGGCAHDAHSYYHFYLQKKKTAHTTVHPL